MRVCCSALTVISCTAGADVYLAQVHNAIQVAAEILIKFEYYSQIEHA